MSVAGRLVGNPLMGSPSGRVSGIMCLIFARSLCLQLDLEEVRTEFRDGKGLADRPGSSHEIRRRPAIGDNVEIVGLSRHRINAGEPADLDLISVIRIG
jgi:hypothetical protein